MDVLSIDNAVVLKSQVDKLDRIRTTRDQSKVDAILDKLTESAKATISTSEGNHEQNLLALAIEAARCRCTVGEITWALEGEWGR